LSIAKVWSSGHYVTTENLASELFLLIIKIMALKTFVVIEKSGD
jgi:hypothetical protein